MFLYCRAAVCHSQDRLPMRDSYYLAEINMQKSISTVSTLKALSTFPLNSIESIWKHSNCGTCFSCLAIVSSALGVSMRQLLGKRGLPPDSWYLRSTWPAHITVTGEYGNTPTLYPLQSSLHSRPVFFTKCIYTGLATASFQTTSVGICRCHPWG